MSHRPHEAADIVPGSRWPSRRGIGVAEVTEVGANRVTFTFIDGARVTRGWLHHLEFREQYEQPYDSRAVRSKFSMYLANLPSFHAFWSRTARNLFARSTTRSPADSFSPARGSPALPPDAIYVGTYAQPFPTDAFLADLHDALASNRPSTPAAA